MCSGVSFEIKSIIEPLATEGAEVPLDITMTFDVAVEQSLQWEKLMANSAHKLIILSLHSCKRHKQE